MKPLELAARFAAFAWYANNRQASSGTTEAEARRFSENNWQVFVPVGQEGWGRLLLRVAKARSNPQHRSVAMRRPPKRQLAAAV